MLEKLRKGAPIVPTTANGGIVRKPKEPEDTEAEEDVELEEVIEELPPAAKPVALPPPPVKAQWSISEMLEQVLAQIPLEKILTRATEKLPTDAVRSAMDTVVAKILDKTPRDKVSQLVELANGSTLKLRLPAVSFQVSENQIQFYISKADIPAEFAEGSLYEFEFMGDRYRGTFMGSFLPSQTFPYPLLSFVKEP